jgi:hypothetical protein
MQPISFVNNTLEDYDLVIFDDVLHSAYEPFEFYQELIKDKNFQNKAKYIFIEVFGINTQQYVNNFLNSANKDSTLLEKVFQNDFTGMGWRYQTYLDLLSEVWEINKELEDSEKLKVICVDQPIYWEGIRTEEDYRTFDKSLIGRDYFMYKIITTTLDNFKGKKKGIFLTNSRHAYKNIKRSNGQLYWNCGTFFNQWHPDKTYSIRIHNVSMKIEYRINDLNNKSIEGLEELKYSWIKMENGLWDKAFASNGNNPIAFPLEANIFGKAKYIGNHMLNVQEEQTMNDAYDAVIFLAPLDNLHFSAKMNYFYNDKFKKELKRRIKLLQGDNLYKELEEEGIRTIEEYIDKAFIYDGITKNNLLQN